MRDKLMQFKVTSLQYTSELNKISIKRRIHNVLSFSRINRVGLKLAEKERKMLLYETTFGEKIYIKYPGKESESNLSEKIRPWDFKPVAFDKNGKQLADITFKNIWDDLSQLKNNNPQSLALLSSIFFRLALMELTEEVTEEYNVEEFDANGKNIQTTIEELNWYKIRIEKSLLNHLNSTFGLIRGLSLEAYIYLNDLLCQNEDCKYYYLDVELNSVDWNIKKGRRNTYLTHLSVLAYLENMLTFTQIMDKFQRGRGVAPLELKYIPKLTGNLIYTKNDD
jgi:hypothetical protein